jgi:hypothetical protein
MLRRSLVLSFAFVLGIASVRPTYAELKAGAAIVDISPDKFPVLINGGMTSRSAESIVMKVHARAIVLDDGKERLAIVVADSCMMPRPLLDEAKELAARRTGMKPDRILISATHTHTAPASMSCLGTDLDPNYVPLLREKLAEAIATAEKNLEPAEVGWNVADAADYTALRRWIIRPDRIGLDPFGNPTLRANMHAGANWDNVTGESGPEDPALSMISLRSRSGRPIALLANFSMHYFGSSSPVHPDYFGLFCDTIQAKVSKAKTESGPEEAKAAPFVAIMSHGCSGDIWRRDYKVPADKAPQWTQDEFVAGLSGIALKAYESIEYRADADLAMAEARIPLKYRVPDAQRLEWARRIVKEMGDRLPKTTEEVYAREQILLHERQSTEVVVQALKIGEIAIATTPTETYALTGLKIKNRSPLPRTMVIELANGGDGYIPPPEQHLLGGYNTWAARSAGLEVKAEPVIAATALTLLEKVTGKPWLKYVQPIGPDAQSILNTKPLAYWRLDEMEGPRVFDHSGNHRNAIYEPGVVFFLDGPRSESFCSPGETNRAAHFAGGRIDASFDDLGESYSVSLWLWNGMPAEGRATSGWFFSRDINHGLTEQGEHVGVGGTATKPGVLIFQKGTSAPITGQTVIDRWTWNHVLIVKDARKLRIYLNGAEKPEIETDVLPGPPGDARNLFFGGRSDNSENWEGRLDEIAVFDRVLRPADLKIPANGTR